MSSSQIPYLAALDTIQDAIYICDLKGNITYANPAFESLFDCLSKDGTSYKGKSWKQFYSAETLDFITANVLPSIEKEDLWDSQLSIKTHSGKEILSDFKMITLAQGDHVCTIRDISESKSLEKEREDLHYQFLEAQKMEVIGRLAGGFAHDFNNILASIGGYTDFLLEDLEDASREKKFVGKIKQGTTQARQLIDQILALSKPTQIGLEVLDIVDIVNETATILKGILPITISVDLNIKADAARVKANYSYITQLMMNLCVNAKDAMNEEGSIGIDLSVIPHAEFVDEFIFIDNHSDKVTDVEQTLNAKDEIRLIKEQDNLSSLHTGSPAHAEFYIKLSLSDEGQGMDHDLMEHIFDPFFSTKGSGKGTGLGLSSARGIVLSHDGGLSVRSKVDEGSEFIIYLPVHGLMPETNSIQNINAEAHFKDATYNILLVEDQASVIAIMELMLERMGHKGTFCSNAEQAIDVLREKAAKFDAIITDYTMPGMTGLELAQTVLEEFPDLPVIMVSGYSKRKLNNIDIESPNIRSVLKKPVDRDVLAVHIHKAVTGYKAERNKISK